MSHLPKTSHRALTLGICLVFTLASGPATAAGFSELNRQSVREAAHGNQKLAQELAEQALAEARKTAPNFAVSIALYNLCTIQLNRGMHLSLGSTIDDLVANEKQIAGGLRPPMIPALHQAAEWAEHGQLWPKAVELRRMAYEIDKNAHGPNAVNTLEALDNLAKTLEGAQQYDEAIAIWSDLANRSEGIERARNLLQLARIYEATGRLQAAGEKLDEITRSASDNQLKGAKRSRRLSNISILAALERAKIALKQGHLQEALDLATSVVKKVRQDKRNAILAEMVVQQLTSIGDYCVDKGMYKPAEEIFASSWSFMPDLPVRSRIAETAIIHYDVLLRRLGKTNVADKIEDESEERAGVGLLNNALVLLRQAKLYDQGLVLARRALAKAQETGTPRLIGCEHIQVATFLDHKGHYQEALAHINEGIRLSRDYYFTAYPRELIPPYTLKRNIQFRLGMKAEAEETQKELLQICTFIHDQPTTQGVVDDWEKRKEHRLEREQSRSTK